MMVVLLLLHRRHLLRILCPGLVEVVGRCRGTVVWLLRFRLVALPILLIWRLLPPFRRLRLGIRRPLLWSGRVPPLTVHGSPCNSSGPAAPSRDRTDDD